MGEGPSGRGSGVAKRWRFFWSVFGRVFGWSFVGAAIIAALDFAGRYGAVRELFAAADRLPPLHAVISWVVDYGWQFLTVIAFALWIATFEYLFRRREEQDAASARIAALEATIERLEPLAKEAREIIALEELLAHITTELGDAWETATGILGGIKGMDENPHAIDYPAKSEGIFDARMRATAQLYKNVSGVGARDLHLFDTSGMIRTPPEYMSIKDEGLKERWRQFWHRSHNYQVTLMTLRDEVSGRLAQLRRRSMEPAA